MRKLAVLFVFTTVLISTTFAETATVGEKETDNGAQDEAEAR